MVEIHQMVKEVAVSKKFLQTTIQTVLKNLHREGDVTLWLVGNQRMRRLNRESRGKDYATDVLSFPLDVPQFIGGKNEWGDIFLCIPKIQSQAKEFSVPYKQELTRMLIHGVLHLLGYDHVVKKEAIVMFGLQEKFLEEVL